MSVLVWLQASWLGSLPHQIGWLGPVASALHVAALVILLGAVLAFDITVLGLDPDIAIQKAGHILLPVARGAFAIQIASGFLLFASAAPAVAAQPLFLVKLALIGLALANVGAFHYRAGRALTALPATGAPAWAKTAATLSLSLWTAITVAGCFIHYS